MTTVTQALSWSRRNYATEKQDLLSLLAALGLSCFLFALLFIPYSSPLSHACYWSRIDVPAPTVISLSLFCFIWEPAYLSCHNDSSAHRITGNNPQSHQISSSKVSGVSHICHAMHIVSLSNQSIWCKSHLPRDAHCIVI